MANGFDELMSAFDSINLHEAAFELDTDGAEEFLDFVDNDEEGDEELVVYDGEADDEEEAEDKDYMGDIVLQCAVCRNCFLKRKEDVVIGEEDKELVDVTEEDLVNIDEPCAVCGSEDGYHMIGKIVPYTEVEVEVEDEVKDEDGEEKAEEEEEVKVEEALEDKKCEGEECVDGECEEDEGELQEAVNKFAKVNEEIEKVDVEDGQAEVKMDGTSVNIDTKEEKDELGIAPLDDEDMTEIEAETEEDDFGGDDEFIDVDMDEVDEEGFEEALKRARPYYESYKVKDAYYQGNKLVVEGMAKLNNGARVKSQFVLRPISANRSANNVRFVVEGFGRRTYCNGSVKNNKLMIESFNPTQRKGKKR